jgi:tyrosyl-tRNA synthetase
MANASELLTRAVEEVVPRKVAEDKLKSGKPLRLYWGIDPTGTKIHLGHSVPLRKMRAFQDAGHHVILLIGSFTAMIGDPTGRDELRQQLSAEDVKKNFETYIDQAKKILDMEKLEIRYNHEWLEKLTFKDILRLTGNFTVQQMLHRDMFAKRMKEDAPISLTEFMYPLMVGYDSVMLDVDVELGGNDQLFNMLAGRTLQTAFKKRDKFVLTTKLIDGTDGRKMSKTYNNCVYLTDAPNEMYGRLLSMPDNLIPLYMECCTDIPMTEVKACELALKGGKENPKVLKMRLAREIVTMYHSKEAAAHAEAEFENVFKNKGLPEDIQEFKAKKGMLLIDALAESKIVTSKSEARRLIEQGGIRIDDKPVTAMDAKAEKGIVRVGKRKFLKIA